MVACMGVLVAVVLAYALSSGRRMAISVIKPLGVLLISVLFHTAITIAEIAISTYTAAKHIPLSWYPLTALTVIPIAVDIPRQWAVWFLLTYSAANGWIALYGLETNDRDAEAETHADKQQGCKPPPLLQPHEIRPHLFTGMRISIQR